MSEELAPCPFCGGTDLVYTTHDDHELGQTFANVVHCQTCFAYGRAVYPIGWVESDEEAKEAWNTRQESQAQSKALDIEIKRPKNFNNWPTVWQSCFNDGVEACKAALPSETAKDQRIKELQEANDEWCEVCARKDQAIAAMQRQIDEWREAFSPANMGDFDNIEEEIFGTHSMKSDAVNKILLLVDKIKVAAKYPMA